MKTIKKTVIASVDFSQDDPTLRISFKDMARILRKYPIIDLLKEKQSKNPFMSNNEILREIILDCYKDLKKNG